MPGSADAGMVTETLLKDGPVAVASSGPVRDSQRISTGPDSNPLPEAATWLPAAPWFGFMLKLPCGTHAHASDTAASATAGAAMLPSKIRRDNIPLPLDRSLSSGAPAASVADSFERVWAGCETTGAKAPKAELAS